MKYKVFAVTAVVVGVLAGIAVCVLNYQESAGLFLMLALSAYLVFRPRSFLYALILFLPLRLFLVGTAFFDNPLFDTAALINIFIPLWTVFYLVANRKRPFPDSVGSVYCLFLGICALSVAYAPDFIEALKYFCRLLTPLCVYLICAQEVRSAPAAEKVVRAILVSAVIPVAVGALQMMGYCKGLLAAPDVGYDRISGTLGHPNPYSFFLLVVFLCALCAFFSRPPIGMRVFSGAVIIASSVLLVSTYCRITWIAFLACMVVISVFARRKILVAALILVLFLAVALDFLNVSSRVHETAEFFRSGESAEITSSIGWRLRAWRTVMAEFLQRPLFGYGLRAHFGVMRSLSGMPMAVHNTYLELLYDVGIVGFLAFMAVLFRLGAALRRAWRMVKGHAPSPDAVAERKYFLLFATVYVSYVVIMISDNITEYYDISIFYWIIFSIGVRFRDIFGPQGAAVSRAGAGGAA